MKEIPVYLFTGFLEAGKTKFIQETFEDPRFNSGENTLLLICEQGIEEIETEKFYSDNVIVEYIEDEENLTEEMLSSLYKKHKFSRMVVEYNGMWSLDKLYMSLPQGFSVYQEMMFVSCPTFLTYNANMRNLVYDKLKSCEMVIFNRADDKTDKEEIHKIVRAANKNAQIAYEYTDGRVEYDEIEDPLPFDIEGPVVKIEDADYALWYRDMAEEPEKYMNKTIKFKALVAKNPKLPEDVFIAGRHVMTCCADDITYTAIVCEYKEAMKMKNKSWISLEGKFTFKYHELYQSDGPVLEITKIKGAEEPENPVATFY